MTPLESLTVFSVKESWLLHIKRNVNLASVVAIRQNCVGTLSAFYSFASSYVRDYSVQQYHIVVCIKVQLR